MEDIRTDAVEPRRRARGAAFFQALIEGSRDAVVVADRHGVIRYQSPAVTRELGYEPESCVGRHVLDFVHPDDRAAVTRTFERADEAPEATTSLELRLRTRTEGWRWVEVRATNLLRVPAVRGVVLHTLVIHQRKVLELGTLAAKIDPHFLYNVLHSIAAMIREGKPADAVTALGRLRELMGSRLHGTGEDSMVPLSEEWDWVRDYLALEKLRFGSEMRVDIGPLPDDLGGVAAPYRIVQPLAENAVKHGIRARTGGGTIQLSATRSGDCARIRVVETGRSRRRPVENVGLGVGLETTRQRLQLHFGDAARLELTVEDTASTAELYLPIRPVAPTRE
ncbi:MAG: PAS domain S-box protein [Gemmatimonadetes bacterium]|nr:PAS domain S-box protein [Gemmatimonadota bacterium]NIQ55336.1 PAS domain S-box protein [Gemmatimonadota bacterium]NIU75539.1 PAS domain S-box protein [Gammaproteobacteria bacterium]NIX45258.1 PAS domain S-box protein [Gemmatimonadota bacterium]NIY09522.1 PAS domain S-box protein [Gemmatimonadota bacterium]